MKKLLIDIGYGIAIIALIYGGCYNILAARPDIMVELPICIRSIFLFTEEVVEGVNLEAETEIHDGILVSETKVEEKVDVPHIHDWKLDIRPIWENTGNGKGRVVFEEVYICDCGEVWQ